MKEATHVGVGRDVYEFKTPVRFRNTVTEIANRSCSMEPGPNVYDAGDAKSSNKDALVLGKILHARYQVLSLSAWAEGPRPCKANLTTRAKFQSPIVDVPLVEVDTRISGHSNFKRRL